jgi:titin
VNRNDFFADSQADISVASGTLGTLDGTCNFWGQSSGPGAGQVDGSVTTSPFLSTGNLAGPCPATVPAAPHPVAAVPLNQAAKVNWVPRSDGGLGITGFVVTPYIGATAQAAHVFNTSATTVVITGLKNGTGYTFKIAETNAIGTGPQSPATGMTIAGAPGKPGNPSVTNGTPGVLKVAFKAPMNNGAAITNFTATCTSSDGGVTRSRSKAAGSPIGVNALTVGKHYTCTAFATNSRGKGPRSNPSAAKVA